jgi:HlyD family secretion protein
MNKLSIVSLAVVSIYFTGCGGGSEKYGSIQKGPFRATIVETGELYAVNSKVITMPMYDWDYGEPKVTELAKEGLKVKKGEVVGKIETAGIISVLGQQEVDLAMARADLNKLVVQQESDLKRFQSDLTSAEAALRMAVIDTQRTRFESPSKIETSRLRLSMAKVEYEKCKKKINTAQNTQKEELLIQKERIVQIVSAIQTAKNTIQQFTLTAPADGMIEYRRRHHGREKVRVGDDISPGEPIIGLPDLTFMKVLTQVNEKDIGKIYAGQPALVRLDAFPQDVFEGSISKIGLICHDKEEKSRIKVFDIEVLIKESNIILRPGMTVSCEIVVADFPDALYVDNPFIYQESNEYYVKIVKGTRVMPTKVILGPRNNKSVMVTGELSAGDKLERPLERGVAL